MFSKTDFQLVTWLSATDLHLWFIYFYISCLLNLLRMEVMIYLGTAFSTGFAYLKIDRLAWVYMVVLEAPQALLS